MLAKNSTAYPVLLEDKKKWVEHKKKLLARGRRAIVQEYERGR